MARKLSTKTRFEVFKRDKFKCQYCGAEAPNVVLHVDHIKPKKSGGADEIINLVTSCAACNGGKGARPLADDSAVQKKRAQLEDLQERREQIEMMLAWQDDLSDAHDRQATAAVDAWEAEFPGWRLESKGTLLTMRKLVRRYGLPLVLDAIGESVLYRRFDPSGEKVTKDSCEMAFRKLGGICKGVHLKRTDPEAAEADHVKNIACRGNFAYGIEIIERVKEARRGGAEWDELKALARRSHSPSSFLYALSERAADAAG